MAIQKTEAVLLYKRDIRETSSLLVFYTKNFGKIKGLIKGVRGTKAKKGYYFREFCSYDLVYYEKRHSDIYIISQCDLRHAFYGAAQDIYKRINAFYVVELVDKFTPLSDTSREIYNLLIWFLTSLDRCKDAAVAKLLTLFEIKFLDYIGFLPIFEACVCCKALIGKRISYSVRLAGCLCENCISADFQALAISRGSYASLNMIRKLKTENLKDSNITSPIAGELSNLFKRFVYYHLGDHLKTPDVIESLVNRKR